MAKNIPVLTWAEATFNSGHAAIISCDSTIDQNWYINLYGTSSTEHMIYPSHVVIDNTGLNSSVIIDFGIARYSVSPYTRKTFSVPRGLIVCRANVTLGVVPVGFFDYDPGIPDEINQVASGLASNQATGGGGGGGTFTNLDPINKNAAITLSNANLTAANVNTGLGAVWTGPRSVKSLSTGKIYTEFNASSGFADLGFGACNAVCDIGIVTPTANTALGTDTNSLAWFRLDGGVYINSLKLVTVVTWTVGDALAMAIDIAAKRAWFKKLGGTWNNTGADPGLGTGGIDISAVTGALFIAGSGRIDGVNNYTFNFGTSTFAGIVPTGFSGMPS